MTVLAIEGAQVDGEVPLSLTLDAGAFVLIETSVRRGGAFADLCVGLVPLLAGRVRVLGRDWAGLTTPAADALRGHVGRLFALPIRAETPDVAARILLGRMHHSLVPEAALRAEAAALALRFGLPGLPAGPARLLSEEDLVRAACVRAFLGGPRLIILELPAAVLETDVLRACLAVGAEARGQGAAVLWLATPGPALRDPSIRATQRFRLTDAGLTAPRVRVIA